MSPELTAQFYTTPQWVKVGKMILSDYGKKLTSRSGILQFMDDLGKAMSGQTMILMLGGGNPAVIPAMQQIWALEWDRLLRT